ncbi:hypothetical protein M885DRAFT_512425 [Pelagophyceae sp. CCMP2097]|nr:hypothetical protein M885DRAFT_512425 [Pelagophyceae sp. CCMP2097]
MTHSLWELGQSVDAPVSRDDSAAELWLAAERVTVQTRVVLHFVAAPIRLPRNAVIHGGPGATFAVFEKEVPVRIKEQSPFQVPPETALHDEPRVRVDDGVRRGELRAQQRRNRAHRPLRRPSGLCDDARRSPTHQERARRSISPPRAMLGAARRLPGGGQILA